MTDTPTVADLLTEYLAGIEHLTRTGPDGRVLRVGSLALTDSGTTLAACNGVTVVGDAWSEADLAHVARTAEDLGRPWSVVVQRGGDAAGDTARRAAAERVAASHGLTERSTEPFLALPLPLPLPGTDGTPRADVRTVGADDWVTYTAAVAAGFGVPAAAFGTAFGGPVLDTPGTTGYVVEQDGAAVASALGITTGRAVGVYDVAVVPERRRRGLGRAVTERVLRDAAARGAATAYLVSTDEGRPLYDALGFRQVEALVRWSAPE